MDVRRRILGAMAAGGVAATNGVAVAQESYPDRPVLIVVPFAAGGNVDVVTRLLGPRLAERLGQPFVVQNRPGAGGNIGAESVARARPDGYMLLAGSNGPMTGNPALQANLPYEPLRDFAPIGLISRVPHVVIVTPSLPVQTIAELVAWSRANPGRATMGSAGTGSGTHLTIEVFNSITNAGLVHVPYRGSGAVIPDLLAGNIAGNFNELSTVIELHREGRARIIGVAAARRSPLLPDVPTLIESGVGDLTAVSFLGLLAPAGTPAPTLEKLRTALAATLAESAIQARMTELGLQVADPSEVTPAYLGTFLREELGRTRRAVEIAGLRPE